MGNMNDVTIMMANKIIGFSSLVVLPNNDVPRHSPVALNVFTKLYLFTKSISFKKWIARFVVVEQQPQYL